MKVLTFTLSNQFNHRAERVNVTWGDDTVDIPSAVEIAVEVLPWCF